MFLAETLHKTVSELIKELTYEELIEWLAYFELKREKEKLHGNR